LFQVYKAMTVDIIIPVYNAEQTIHETLDSVYAQTFKDFRIIAVDNGSKDGSYDIIRHRCHDAIRWHEAKGPAWARNAGLHFSTAEFFLPLDADDMIEPTFLEKTLDRMTKQTGIVSTGMIRFGLCRDYIRAKKRTFEEQMKSNEIPITSLVRREAYDRTEGYQECVPGWEDWELWISILEDGWDHKIVDEPLFIYRCHSTGMNAQANDHKGELRQKMIQMHSGFQG